MKIYTKTGDKGDTRLMGGKHVSKADPRIVAYGAVDELNSSIGLAISFLRSKQSQQQLPLSDIADVLLQVQNDLEKMASALESIIDRFESELKPITFFILPGGSIESSLLHHSRGVARRTETAVVLLSKNELINPAIMIYINRLSDLLFVMARLANKRLDVPDVAWRA